MLGYSEEQIDSLPPATVESFAGTGNPLSMGALQPGETVLDLGCGAGFDALLAAQQVGPSGRVIAIDMTQAMLEKTRAGAAALGLGNVDTRQGFAEDLPLDDASVDVVISNGVINLCPDKLAVMRELARVLKPGGRLQIADIVVGKPLPQSAKEDIELCPAELPVLCCMQSGTGCCRSVVSWTCAGAGRWTSSLAPSTSPMRPSLTPGV